MILVVGGTRGTGLLIVRLLERQNVPVRVLARDPANARRLLSSSVEVVKGDITHPHTLPPAIEGASHIIFTAGCRSGHPVGEAQIKATEYEGVRNTLAAARDVNFAGRFLYMTSSGVNARSIWSVALNMYKGNTLVWRRRAEDEIRASGLPYTIIRTGMLLNRPGGTQGIRLTQESLPLSPFHRIPRADVAEAFLAALDHPRAVRTTFEIVSDRNAPREPWSALMQSLKLD
jgi:uncharacterized protein YbjT (DUF2867 family)